MSLAGQSARTHQMPIVNLCLIVVNLVIFLYQLSLGPQAAPFIGRFGLVPAQVGGWLGGNNGDALTLLALITAMFLQANWLQLAGNMVFLWIFGAHVEDRLGSGWYLGFYLLCGAVANLAQVFIDPSSNVAVVGASGAIAGVLAAYVLAYSGMRVPVAVPIVCIFTVVDIPSLLMIGAWFIVQLLTGASAIHEFSQTVGGIAWWAQVAGFACGLFLVTVLPKQVNFAHQDWSGSIAQRAQEDTGFVGFLIGAINLVSQMIQLALAARILALFFDFGQASSFSVYVDDLRRYTDPLVLPFNLFLSTAPVFDRQLDLAAMTAVFFFVIATSGLIWLVAALLYEPNLPVSQESRSRSYV